MVEGSLRKHWSVLLLAGALAVALLPIAPSVVACLDGSAPGCCERLGSHVGASTQAGLHAGTDCHCCVVVDQVAEQRASPAKVSPAVPLEAAPLCASTAQDAVTLARAHAPHGRDTALLSLRSVVLLI